MSFNENINLVPIQKCFLFSWNPNQWYQWNDPTNVPYIEDNIIELKNTGSVTLKWSCRSHKKIRIGDRAFLVRLGSKPRGVMASGTVVSNPFLSNHWSGEDKLVPRVLIKFDVLLNPEKDPILLLDALAQGNLSKQTWTPQTSGISIRNAVVYELEEKWFNFLKTENFRYSPFIDEIDDLETFVEGSVVQVSQTKYERNIYARQVCLNYYGYSCVVCNFNFEAVYGPLGHEFIHVHHLKELSSIKEKHNINPKEDLRPVCPNCHAMLHRSKPPLPIEELISRLK